MINWADGLYGYNKNDTFGITGSINKSYEYLRGNKSIATYYILQGTRVTLLLLCTIALFYELFNKNRKYNFIIVTLFGGFLFYNFWEVQARYAFSFILLFMIIAAIGFEKIINTKIDDINLNINNKNKKIDYQKVKKYFHKLVVIITILLFIINYSYYAVNKVKYRTKAIYTMSNTAISRIYINHDDILTQTFSTKVGFNSIIIKFFKKADIEGNLILELYDNNKGLLYQGEKNIKELPDDCNVEFAISNEYNTHDKPYYLKVYTTVNEENTVGVWGLYRENYDHMPSGTLSINGDEQVDTDLQMNINKRVNASRMSKRVYIPLAVFLIIIELFSFDFIRIKIKRNKN